MKYGAVSFLLLIAFLPAFTANASECSQICTRPLTSEESFETFGSFGALQYVPPEEAEAKETTCASLSTIKADGCARAPHADSACADGKLAIVANSCLMKDGFHRIDAIQYLKPGGTLDIALLKSASVNDIARNLVVRVYRLRDVRTMKSEDFMHPRFVPAAGLELQIAFNPAIADKIAKNGFLNQHQTGTTGGCDCPDDRLHAEGLMTRLVFSGTNDHLKAVLPKYSFAPARWADGDTTGNGYTSGYGALIAVLNDNLKMRATFDGTDSLGRPSDVHSFRYQKAASSYRTASDGTVVGGYIEGQVWGNLSFRDAKTILAGCFEKDDLSSGEWQKLADTSGVPIHECVKKTIRTTSSRERDFPGQYFTSGKLIASPKTDSAHAKM